MNAVNLCRAYWGFNLMEKDKFTKKIPSRKVPRTIYTNIP